MDEDNLHVFIFTVNAIDINSSFTGYDFNFVVDTQQPKIGQ